MEKIVIILILALCGGALPAQVTKVDPARLVKPAASANRMLITNGSSATAWGQASDLLTAGTGINVSGNTVTNTAPSLWTLSGSDIYRISKVGIGTATPNNTIQVVELINFDNTDFNSFLGYQSGKYIVSGAQYNTFLGYQSGFGGSGTSTADFNVGVGAFTLSANTSGSRNVAVGYSGLQQNTSGSDNMAIGFQSLYANTVGLYNGSLGTSSLYANTTGDGNTGIGYLSLYSNTTGDGNTGVGGQTLFDLNISTNDGSGSNTAIGYNTGRGIVTGVSNTIIGARVIGLPANLSNNIILADGDGNRRINVDNVGNVGIGTTSPTQKLDVNGNVRLNGALYDGTNSAGSSGYVLGSTTTATQWLSPAFIVTAGLGFVQNGNSFTANAVIGTNDAYTFSIKTNNIVRAVFDNSNRFRLTPVSSDPASPATGDTWLNDTDDRAVHHFTNNTRRVRYTDDDTRPGVTVYREDFIKTNALPALWIYNGDASTLSATDYRFGYGAFAVSTNQLGASANGFATLSQDADLLPSTGTYTYTMSVLIDLVNVPTTTNTGDIWIGIGGGNANSITDPDDFVGFRVNPFDGSSAKYSFVIRKNGTSTSSSGSAIATGKRILKVVWTNSSVSFYEDDVLLLNQTTMTNSPTGETGLSMMFKAKSAASATYPIAAVVASAIMKIE